MNAAETTVSAFIEDRLVEVSVADLIAFEEEGLNDAAIAERLGLDLDQCWLPMRTALDWHRWAATGPVLVALAHQTGPVT